MTVESNNLTGEEQIVMKNKHTRLAAGALALTLGLTQLPNALAADSSDASGAATGTTQPSASPDGTPPDGTGTPPNGTGTPPNGGQQGGTSFSDVTSDAWYYNYVNFVSMRHIMTGTNGKFSPDAVITRAAYVQALYQAAGSPEVTATTSFTDVSSDSEYASAIAWAKENDIAEGSTDGKFYPGTSLTREMAMTFLYRALDTLDVTEETVTGDPLSDFSDKSSISSWATSGMSALAQMGIITGTDKGTINPKNALTNAEVAAMLYRALGGDSQNGGMGTLPGGQNGSGTVTNGTAATTITEDGAYSNTTYSSTGDDENALRIDGATVTFSGITVSKTAGSTSSTENGDFYGMNAGLLALNGAEVTIKNATIKTGAQNGNGVFSYGEGTAVTISNSTIRTTADNSGGIQTTGGGTTYANDLDVETQGNSSAAIRSDRGGGTVVVNGGTYESNGTGSPAVYSTADITVEDAALTANNSEAVVVEGKNSVALTDCDVTGNMTGTYQDDSEHIHNIMLYQSMSGDAEEGNASFSMIGGSLTAKAGDMFYVTNTTAKIYLSGVDMSLANDTLLTVAGNSSGRGWGTEGANGGTATFTSDDQTLTGDVTCDEISSLNFALENGSDFTGNINTDGEGGEVNVSIDSDSTWTLTGDCYVTSVDNDGTIDYNGYTIYLADGSSLSD